MLPKPPPLVPSALNIENALARSTPLARLRERLADAEARLAALGDLLAPALIHHVRAGPVDETGWTLLARNAAAAAKLRQLQPLFEKRLAERGWPACTIRIRIQSTT